MKTEIPQFMLEVFLQPGEYYWGDKDTRIRTILGSCIAMCFWHPERRIGGMIHYMLPKRLDIAEKPAKLDGKYGDEAVALVLQDMKKNKTTPDEYEVKIFGGANMFKRSLNSDTIQIGERNIVQAHNSVKENGFRVKTENVGQDIHRSIMFDLWSGDVWLKKPKTD